MSQRAVSPQVSSFTDQTWSRVGLDAPPFHSNNKSIPFHLGPSGHFSSGCLRVDLTAMLGLQSFAWFFFAFYFPPHILYHNILSEPATTVFLKTDLVQTHVLVAYSR